MKKKNTLHCCVDDKFIKGAISLFETDDRVENTYTIVTDKKEFKYLDTNFIKPVTPDSFLDFCSNYDVVVLHNLSSLPLEIISRIPRKIKVVCFSWGSDIYSPFNPIIPMDLYEKKTKHILDVTGFFSLKKFLAFVKYKTYKKRIRERALQRIDFYSGVFPYEYDLIAKNVRGFVAKPLDFYYGSTNFFIPEIPDQRVSEKDNVIIGNSGDSNNNHLDIIDYLEHIEFPQDCKIIMPMSYGGSKKYVTSVIKDWSNSFKSIFTPVLDYLPLDDYLELISNCRTAIYYQNRQSASDNVFMQLMFGARVFMSNKNAMFHYLKDQGYHIFSLQDDVDLLLKPLSEKEVFENRLLLSNQYSTSRLIDRIKTINDQLYF